MTPRSERLGLEPGSIDSQCQIAENENIRGSSRPGEREISHSIAISLKRIADRLDDIASGTASLNVDVRQA